MENNYINCDQCGRTIEVGKNTLYSTSKHYCLDCRINKRNQYATGKRRLQKYTCDECHKSFAIEIGRAEARLQKYGSTLCTSCSKKGMRNPFFNKRFTSQQKNILSQKRKDYYNDPILGNTRRQEQRQRMAGSNNPMYKGKEYCSNYYTRNKTIRRRVLKRDDNICQCCHKKYNNKFLVVHHKNGADKFIDTRLSIDNCITLCINCHKLFHHIYGYGNNTEEQFIKFLQKSSETIERQ